MQFFFFSSFFFLNKTPFILPEKAGHSGSTSARDLLSQLPLPLSESASNMTYLVKSQDGLGGVLAQPRGCGTCVLYVLRNSSNGEVQSVVDNVSLIKSLGDC